MGQKTIYAVANGNWDAANNWADNADGSGSTYTNPANGGGTTYLCDLNAKAITVNVAVNVDSIRTGVTNVGGTLVIPDDTSATITVATATTGIYSNYAGSLVTWTGITTASSLTINGDVQYASTSSSGMLPYGEKATLVINGKVTCSSSGYCCVGSSTGILTISNAGGQAVANTSSGRGVNHVSSGVCTITGDVAASGTVDGIAVRIQTTGATVTVTGTVTSSAGIGLVVGTGVTNPSVTLSGSCTRTAGGICIRVASGTFTWISSVSLSALAYIEQTGGTIALASESGALDMTISGHGTFALNSSSGTITTTSGANTASIVLSAATAHAAIVGGTDANREIITGASIPSAADTRYGVTRGWADGGTSATSGCGVAGGNGLLEIPNSGTPTGTQDATSDACVVSGKKYGSPQRTGSAAGGGYTYGDESQDKVLTTATGAGTYQPVAASAVQKGVAVGVSPAVGTLVGIVDSSGTQHDYGTCSSAQAWDVDGIIHTSGTAATSGIITSGGGYYATGLLIDANTYYATGWWNGASYVATPDFPDVGNVTTTDTVNGSTGTLDLSLYTLISGIVSASDVRKGVARYSGGSNGTLVGCIDTDGANQGWGILDDSGVYYAYGITDDDGVFHGTSGILDNLVNHYTSGTLDSSGNYNATGVIYGAGSYATEASRNSMTATATEILSGYSVTLLGSTTNGSATAEAHTANQVISTAGGSYDVSNVAAGNIRDTVSIGGVMGTFTHTSDYQAKTDSVLIAAISAAIIKDGEIITATSGGTHVDGTYDPITGNYTDPGKAWVVAGHDYTFAGVSQTAEYPTTATSQAAQLATDQAVVAGYLENIDGGVTILGQVGTGVNATTAQAAAAAALAAWGKTGFSLAATGLDSITATEPTAKPTTFPGWIMWLIQRFRRADKSSTQIKVLTEAGATVTTQTITAVGADETVGAPS